jgi:hypothetical protein
MNAKNEAKDAETFLLLQALMSSSSSRSDCASAWSSNAVSQQQRRL